MLNTNAPKVAAVIPTHSRWIEAELCLSALAKSDCENLVTVLVDDGSTDGTADACRREYPSVQLVEGDGNLWWSGAVNLGVRRAMEIDADYVLLLNDDNRVEPDLVSRLVECAREVGGAWIVCSRQLSLDSSVQIWAGDPPIWDPRSYSLVRGKFRNDAYVISPNPPGGQGVLIPMECFYKAGLMDAGTFPQYYGDHDFYSRAEKCGYGFVIDFDAIVRCNFRTTGVHRRETPATLRWTFEYLFGRRSVMNLIVLAKYLWRHCPKREMPQLYLRQVRIALATVGYAWICRSGRVHKLYRYMRPLRG